MLSSAVPSNSEDSLQSLPLRHPLPRGWSVLSTFSDLLPLGDLVVRRVGVESERARDGRQAHGSAAGTGAEVEDRAWFELLERTALVDQMESRALKPVNGRRPAVSNGVALHHSWDRACRAAWLELVERHRVLQSWEGLLRPIELSPPGWLQSLSEHNWRAVQLGNGDPAVAAVVGFPKSPTLPLARGFAARPNANDALEAAAREAVQGLAFLWDEEIPQEPPRPDASPIYHLDYYLYPAHHQLLLGWLNGERYQPQNVRAAGDPTCSGFDDLTPTGWGGKLRVARAVSADALPLVFGPPREAQAVHPIP